MTPRLILASASPQRKEILGTLGLDFSVEVSGVDESANDEKDPAKRSLVLARLKALDIHDRRKDAFVIGCDTLVVSSDGQLLEKPVNEDDARRMLKLHSGNASVVHSGLCIVDPGGNPHEGISSSVTRFRKLTDKDIDWWIGTDLWKGRSGGFQIDGVGQYMIESIEGDYPGIVGLPVFLLGKLLKQAGYPLML